MIDAYIAVIPPVVIFFIGYFFKRIGVLKEHDGALLLKVVFYLLTPALILQSLSHSTLSVHLLFIPLIAALIQLGNFILAFFIGKRLKLVKKTYGSFLLISMIMNTLFVLPFFLAVYGKDSMYGFVLFDMGNMIITFSFAYVLACLYGENKPTLQVIGKKILLAPPIYAVIVAFVINIFHLPLPVVMLNLVDLLSNATVPLIMLSLGCYLNFRYEISKLPKILVAILLRMGAGFMWGALFVLLFHLSGLARQTVLVFSLSPVAFMTLTYSTLENLDSEFTAAAVSLSILLSIIVLPILLTALK